VSSITSTTHFNWLPPQSAYSQLQAQRAQRAADNSDFLDTASSLAGSFSDAMSSQYDGVANLAADAAAKRLGIALPSQSDSSTTSSSSSDSSSSSSSSSVSTNTVPDPVASMNDYLNTLDQILNGTSSVVSQTQSEISSAGSAQGALDNMLDGANIGGTSSATENEIADGISGLASSAQNQISSDGNMFSTIDRIINTTVAPSNVDVTA
jgi:hypothetical protein